MVLPRKKSASATPAPSEGCATLRMVLVTVPRVSRSRKHFPDGFDLLLLQSVWIRNTNFLGAQEAIKSHVESPSIQS